MFQNDDKAKRERSVKLCQLVYDRKNDDEIGYEIRKLLEAGVLIDFQDQNRNKKTAIHLAVEKCDVTCVKFLLPFGPSLGVKDGDGKTPIKLAEINEDQTILNVLLESTVALMNESYIEVIDFQSLTRHKIEAIKARPTFKVLKLINCSSINVAWNKLNAHNKTLNDTSHLFFIAIETTETDIDNDKELMKKTLNLRRPMIVQLRSSSSKNSKIYFKDEKDFLEIPAAEQTTQKEFDEAIKLEEICSMKLLVTALRSNLIGHFTDNLLDTKLYIDEDESKAVNQFVKANALCHRFFKLFDKSMEIVRLNSACWLGLSGVLNVLRPNLLRKVFFRTATRYKDSEPTQERIVAALSFKGDQSLMALLDLPFELKDEKLKLNGYQQDVLSLVDYRDYDLLVLAVEHRNLDVVKLLLRCGCNLNYSDENGKRDSDFCWEMKAFDCLAELIEAGSPYPINFSLDEVDDSEAHERIKKNIKAINSFHDHIEQGEIEEVKKFIMMDHLHIKHAFDTKNKCALTVALQSNKIEMHSLLLSEGFEPGVDDEYYFKLDTFKNKDEIRNSHRKYFKQAFNEPHLKRLLKKYKLSFGSKDRAKCSTTIRKMFDELNEIVEVIPILQICSFSDELRIVFDFNCNSVTNMDPSSGSDTLGILYPISGFIYIGAKNHEKEFSKVIGTLIHELTHLAMKLTYKNDCKPYDEDDKEGSKRFEDIKNEIKNFCDTNTSTDPIVTRVFSCYDQSAWHQELIVRVPHLLAHYKNNSKLLRAAERNTRELFHFYREKTLKDVETEGEILLQKYLIRKINSQTGIARKIENLKVKFAKVEDIELKSVTIITSNAPQLTLVMLHQVCPENSHIFVTLEQIAIGNIADKLTKLKEPTLIVDCMGLMEQYQDTLRELTQSNKNLPAIAFVMTEAETSTLKENFADVEFKTFTHEWNELNEISKINLLNLIVIFQGIEVTLSELVKSSSKAMDFFPLCVISNSKDLIIGNTLQESCHSFYINRKLIKIGQKDSKVNAKSFEEFSHDEMNVAIISDEPGSGKSVTLFEIAKSLHAAFPDRWIQFVDLKFYIEAFKSIKDYKKIETFEDFISEQILKNGTKFNQELFLQMFRDGKTCVLFDGFDEISPNYKELLLHVLSLFKHGSGNQLFITTRPHLETDLEKALGNFVFKLETFSEECQKNFLRNYWQSVPFKSPDEFDDLSKRLLEKFAKLSKSNFVGLPLLMHMTAEIFSDPVKENSLDELHSMSVASIFKDFVRKYSMRWKKEGSEISRKENAEIEEIGGILEIHHNIAIKHKVHGDLMNFDIDEDDAKKIARVGLIQYDKVKKTFQFIHETFAEYFVADFVFFHLKRKNQNPMHDCSLAVQVLVEVFGERHYIAGYYNVIKTFLDEILKTRRLTLNEASCQSAAKCFSEVMTSKNCFDVLRESLRGKTENVAILLFPIVEHVEEDVLMKILHSDFIFDGDYHSTALRNATNYGSSVVVSAVCNIITTRVGPISAEIFQQSSRTWNNVLYLAAGNKNSGIFTVLCKSMESSLTREKIGLLIKPTIIQYSNILGIVVEWSNDDVLQELLSLLPSYLTNDEMRGLMCHVDSSVEKLLATRDR